MIRRLDDFGITRHETKVPILRVPAIAFLYILGKAEAEGHSGFSLSGNWLHWHRLVCWNAAELKGGISLLFDFLINFPGIA